MLFSCRSYAAVAVVGMFLVNSAAVAQTATDSIAPRAGTWAAEASYGGGGAASLLYISSPRAAWLLRATFSVGSQTLDEPQFAGGVTTTTRTTSALRNFSLAAGRRWWSGEPSARLRPFTGLGLTGRYSAASDARETDVGAYGELGASYFFSPHVSLGAAGELDAGVTSSRFGSSALDAKARSWMVSGNLVRFMATVYF